MEAMRRAFHKVCETLQLGDNDDAFMEIVAAKAIIATRAHANAKATTGSPNIATNHLIMMTISGFSNPLNAN